MELITLKCCRKTVHRLCLLAWLSQNSQCIHCRRVLDISKVLEFPVIEREVMQEPAPVARSLQEDLNYAEEKTPLRDTDRVRQESQEMRRQSQLAQANRMMKAQGNQLTQEGCGPGAVVTVLVDYRAVSHGIGIVGVVLQYKESGGVRVATQHGIISHARGVFWIPTGQYIMSWRRDEHANIPPDLQSVRDAIIDCTYDEDAAAKLSIQEVHQRVTNSISPCRKGKCSCTKGNCSKGRCGCIKKGYKCTSACSCNGNCTGNVNNGK